MVKRINLNIDSYWGRCIIYFLLILLYKQEKGATTKVVTPHTMKHYIFNFDYYIVIYSHNYTVNFFLFQRNFVQLRHIHLNINL